ncbi:MAG: hypothetical protein RMM98_06705 [Acidobacteriota bacterium]|nr:hypothetical protein [Blastocatellia bacterium]MDW8239287.1 hypothetical protein [Acidobacteriota bacterium]
MCNVREPSSPILRAFSSATRYLIGSLMLARCWPQSAALALLEPATTGVALPLETLHIGNVVMGRLRG